MRRKSRATFKGGGAAADDWQVAMRHYGVLPGGEAIEEYSLASPHLELRAITLGGIITAVHVPDRQGHRRNVVLAHPELPGYLSNVPYVGAIVGRYAKGIANGHFVLDGREHQLSINDGSHHLHGGTRGFDQRIWAAQTVREQESVAVTFSRVSADGEEGYPGHVRIAVTYRVTRGGDIELEYHASTDAATVINLTQHSYFNLSDGTPDICGHELSIAANRFTPVDGRLIPIGTLQTVAGTPFDFRAMTSIGARIDGPDEQLRHAGGYDHNWVLNQGPRSTAAAATLHAPDSGRVLEVRTDQPGIQFYSGNFLPGRPGADRRSFGYRAGCCLETQHFPDSPNHLQFPPTVIRPGRPFHSRTTWRFSCR